ncbi:hypothetical protein BDD12DRAFT_818092 [Trichophaea hybrida]|nr:hypothetical protein BDD12DRAFT_818092 [Trichophaea hybrida]
MERRNLPSNIGSSNSNPRRAHNIWRTLSQRQSQTTKNHPRQTKLGSTKPQLEKTIRRR